MVHKDFDELARFGWFIFCLVLWLIVVSTARELFINAPYTDPLEQHLALMGMMWLFTGPLFALAPYIMMEPRDSQTPRLITSKTEPPNPDNLSEPSSTTFVRSLRFQPVFSRSGSIRSFLI
jgi:hypothetical protein